MTAQSPSANRIGTSSEGPSTAAVSPTMADNLGLARMLDVTVEVTAELGRRRLTIGEAVALSAGHVVSFAKSPDEPLELRVNGKLVAFGEAVVFGDRYGIRITEVVQPDNSAGRHDCEEGR